MISIRRHSDRVQSRPGCREKGINIATTSSFPAAEMAARTSSERSAGAQERLVFIDFRCTFLGEVRRADLMARFGIASAAATRDLALYKGVLGGRIQMDPVTKVYRPANDFAPLFTHNVGRTLTALTRGFGESQPGAAGKYCTIVRVMDMVMSAKNPSQIILRDLP